MDALANSPAELIAKLSRIFQGFRVELDSEDDSPESFHSVLLFDFNPFFVRSIDAFTPKQLKALAELVTRSCASPSSLENAFDTCFLEHMNQMRVNKHLGKYLREAEKAIAK